MSKQRGRERLHRHPYACCCKAEDSRRYDDISHFIDMNRGRGEKIHSISVNFVESSGTLVESCRYKNDVTISRMLTNPYTIPVKSISKQGASILLPEMCCPPNCISELVDGRYMTNTSNNEYYSTNGVNCPICGRTPDKFSEGKFYHNLHTENMYSCYAEHILKEYIKNPDMFPIKVEKDVSSWSSTDNGFRFIKDKKTDGSKVLQDEFMRLEQSKEQMSKKLEELSNVKSLKNTKNDRIDELVNENGKLQRENSKLQSEIDTLKREKALAMKSFSNGNRPKTSCDVNNDMSRQELVKKMREIQNNTIGESYVYVIIVKREGEEYFYVGKSNNPSSRIKNHINKKNVVGIERVEGCISESSALERERELSYEIAIEKDTTNILGGK